MPLHAYLTEYWQRFTRTGGDTIYKPIPFNNLPPLLVKDEKTVVVIRQSG